MLKMKEPSRIGDPGKNYKHDSKIENFILSQPYVLSHQNYQVSAKG
jgi:hypothetical protein